MKQITEEMIRDYKLKQLGIDFMGYEWQYPSDLSFHHLIIPRRNCKAERIPNDGYVKWNGAILKQKTSHDYLHTIERLDYERFLALTSELIEQNMLGKLTKENLLYIHDILCSFEREYSGSGIIKPEYTRRLIKK